MVWLIRVTYETLRIDAACRRCEILAQASQSDNEAKIIRCRQNSTELIWLDRAALRARCGIWSHVNTTKTPGGEREQIVYNKYFYVYLHNGVVTSVKKRRQIFTGFKLRP